MTSPRRFDSRIRAWFTRSPGNGWCGGSLPTIRITADSSPSCWGCRASCRLSSRFWGVTSPSRKWRTTDAAPGSPDRDDRGLDGDLADHLQHCRGDRLVCPGHPGGAAYQHAAVLCGVVRSRRLLRDDSVRAKPGAIDEGDLGAADGGAPGG